MSARTRPCDAGVIAGRMTKAEQFLDAAETIREFADDEAEVGDAYVTLCIHAGIAAADVICCVNLGQHAIGESHQEAIGLLRTVAPDGGELADALRTLLRMKTRAGYAAAPITAQNRTRAPRAATKLVDAARQRRPG